MREINYSIIIPHYNSPILLDRLVNSIPMEKSDVEVIVVDDRSDRDIELLLDEKRKLEASGVHFFRNNSGIKGPGTCRNIGMRHAEGKWLIFADADDAFTEDFYPAVCRYCDSYADIVYFMASSLRSDGSEGERHQNIQENVSRYLADRSRYNELKLRTDNLAPWAKMVKRGFVQKNDILFGSRMVSEDVVFSVKCGIKASGIDASDRTVYCVSEGESLTYGSDRKKILRNIEINNDTFIWMYKYLKKNLSAADWKMLGYNGNMKFVEAYQQNYGLMNIIRMFFKFEINGVRAIDLKNMSVKTAPDTLKHMIETRKRLNG